MQITVLGSSNIDSVTITTITMQITVLGSSNNKVQEPVTTGLEVCLSQWKKGKR